MRTEIISPSKYTFVASTGVITIPGREIPKSNIILISSNEPGKERDLYVGNNVNLGATVTHPSGNTVIDLSSSTSDLLNSSPLHIRVFDEKVGTVIKDGVETVADGSDFFIGVQNTCDHGSFSCVVDSDVDVQFSYKTFALSDGNTPMIPVQAPISVIDGQPEPDGRFRLRIGNLNVNAGSWDLGVVNNSGGPATVSIFVMALKEPSDGAILPVGFPLNKSLSLNTANSFISGQAYDNGLNPLPTSMSVGVLPNGGFMTGSPSVVISEVDIDPPATIPSGPIPTIHPVLNTEANVVGDTGWYDTLAFPGGQVFNAPVKDQDLLVFLLNAKNTSGDKMTGNDTPFLTPPAGEPTFFGFDYPDRYARVVVINNSGNPLSNYRHVIFGRQTPPSGLFTAFNQPLFDSFPALVTQSVPRQRASNATGYYSPAVHVSPLNSGYVSQAVFVGPRPGQVFGRSEAKLFSLALTSSGIIGNTYDDSTLDFFCIEGIVSATNTSGSTTGRVLIRSGVSGDPEFSMRIEETGVGVTKVGNGTFGSDNSPAIFTSRPYLQIAAGTISADVILRGYFGPKGS